MTELPKGHVKEVCKEWLVREDGALAQRLQSQEINEFYQNNKVRNAIVREDFPTALNEQRKEVEVAKEVEAKYREYLENQERTDRLLAEKLEHNLKIEKLRNEEIDTNITKEIACMLQKKEDESDKERMLAIQTEVEKAEKLAKRLQIYEEQYSVTQAERDRIIAIRAQNEELAEKDRQLAIEAQDEELAKMLQEREKKRAKRLREKHRLKKQQQQQQLLNQQPNDSQQFINDSVTSNDILEIDDTYSNPIDLILSDNSMNRTHENNNENFNPKRLNNNHISMNDRILGDDDSNDETYALPFNVKKEDLTILREKKPKLPKPNSIHELPNHNTNMKSEFVLSGTVSSLNRSGNHSKRNLSIPTTPISIEDGHSISVVNDSFNRKKKDKKDKCTHQ